MELIFPKVSDIFQDKILFNKYESDPRYKLILHHINDIGIERAISSCTSCNLRKEYEFSQVAPMLPSGKLDAKYVFISKSPTQEEYFLGEPLSSQTPIGGIFDEYLTALNIKREDCFLTYTCHCPVNKDRKLSYQNEILKCSVNLLAEFYFLLEGSRIVFLLGNDPCKLFLGEGITSSTNLIGQVYRTLLFDRETHLIPLLNPLFLARKPKKKPDFFQYLKEVSNFLQYI
jgi:uracil-DNA glycosylase family 4